jgi:hypothetical protein
LRPRLGDGGGVSKYVPEAAAAVGTTTSAVEADTAAVKSGSEQIWASELRFTAIAGAYGGGSPRHVRGPAASFPGDRGKTSPRIQEPRMPPIDGTRRRRFLRRAACPHSSLTLPLPS